MTLVLTYALAGAHVRSLLDNTKYKAWTQRKTYMYFNSGHIVFTGSGCALVLRISAWGNCILFLSDPRPSFRVPFAKGIQRGGQYIVGVLKQACTDG